MSKKQKKPVDPSRRGRRPMPRGWPGPGGGYSTYLQAPQEWRGTTVQVCGMWPFAAGTGSPMVGVPIGRNILSGATMCCDPISWFMRAKLISNPSMFVLGKPGLGKSTITRRMALGLAGYGVMPLVLGDLKPDYKDLIEALGGQVIQLGRGRGHLNVLDPGESREAALRLTGKAREAIQADAHGRRQTMVSALIAIMRNQNPNDREETILDEALKVLDERFQGTPVLRDLLQVVQDAPDRVRNVALDRGSLDRYRQITEGLEASLIGLVGGGRLGEIFSEQTDNPMPDGPSGGVRRVQHRRLRDQPAGRRTAGLLVVRVRRGRGLAGARGRRTGAAAALLRHPRRAVAGAAGRKRSGRPRRRADPAEPAAWCRHGDDLAHHVRPARAAEP